MVASTATGLLLALIVGSITAARELHAQQLPSVEQVADRIGQEVEFQDEVKAVSFSRSTDGYYLSFGAPYPAQVVSVWISRSLYDGLPARGALVGRTVRIKGHLEKAPTGPLVKLETPAQFRLLQVEEGVLSKPLLDGKRDRDQLRTAVWQNFVQEDFETLDLLAEELRQSRERFGDGTWISDAFFSAFRAIPTAPEVRFSLLEEKTAKWLRARPSSLAAVLVKAAYHHDLASRARRDDASEFERELTTARELLEKNAAAKMYPEYFALMQSIALAQRWPRDEYFRLFDEAIRSEPDYYKFYFYAAESLLPRWNGRSDNEWVEFAESQRQRRGAGAAGDMLYARIAWSMTSYYGNVVRETGISWDVMASGFDYLLKEYPESQYLKNAYGWFAWKARDRSRLQKLLPQIVGDPDMTVWVNLENVENAETFAAKGR